LAEHVYRVLGKRVTAKRTRPANRRIHPLILSLNRHYYSYRIRIGEVRILSPTPAMIIVGVMVSPPAHCLA
jgi:mRNA-degrading endonuclease RelE of RelBE toxin-antitoxin system